MKNYLEDENGWIIEALLVLLFGVGCLLAMIAISGHLDQRERAAYLEGRYDLDHASAITLGDWMIYDWMI